MLKPSSPAAIKLFHEGAIAIAQMEKHGMRVDTDYVDHAIDKCTRKIKKLEAKLRADDVWKLWVKEFGTNAGLGKDEQLAHVIFDRLKYESKIFTKSGRASTKAANLIDVDLPFVRRWVRMGKLEKARDTFLAGIKRFTTPDGRLHGSYALNIAASFRSQSSDPNMQNYPTRDEEQAELVRSAFIASEDSHLVESDFSGVEVGTACAYNKDANLIHDYTVGDMHRDMAIKCFKLDPKTDKGWWKTKGDDGDGGYTVRYCAKNMFVFPNFYGSDWVACARSLWEAIPRLKLHSPDGLSMDEHLRKMGIKKLGEGNHDTDPAKGTFQAHIRDVESEFWNVRYRTYTEWKKSTWEAYKRKGYCELLTGFICSRDSDGLVMNRKQVINYQIQGAAFHCLLWVLIEMTKWLKKNKMRSKIVSQIHDSIIGDVHKDELQDYLGKVNELMTVDLLKAWRWINVPLKAEMEVSPLEGNWYQKVKVA